jgi:hypothetical protein
MVRRHPYGLVPELISKTALSLRGLSTGRSGFVGRRKSELGRDWGNCSGRKPASRFFGLRTDWSNGWERADLHVVVNCSGRGLHRWDMTSDCSKRQDHLAAITREVFLGMALNPDRALQEV